MIDSTLLAIFIFIIYMVVFIVGLVRRGLGWSFALFFITLYSWYESIYPVGFIVVLLVMFIIHLYIAARGEEFE